MTKEVSVLMRKQMTHNAFPIISKNKSQSIRMEPYMYIQRDRGRKRERETDLKRQKTKISIYMIDGLDNWILCGFERNTEINHPYIVKNNHNIHI